MWDVRGGFQNAREKVVIKRCQGSKKAKRCIEYLKDFFQAQEFTMEWDGKMRGKGKTNVEALQGSPLSLVVYLIFMAPILQVMDIRVKEATNLDMELPSYVDDILASITDKRGRKNMGQIIDQVDKVVNQVAEEWDLLLELEIMERIIFNRKRKGKRKDAKWIM